MPRPLPIIALTLFFFPFLLHLLPAISAGAFAWAGARFTSRDHGKRIGRLERHNSWTRRKVEKLETCHLHRHPEDADILHVEQINGKPE
jgi:hypothetical protein